jgi:SpoVK/Ycf46/Vps4 family AAA+-type ATPase
MPYKYIQILAFWNHNILALNHFVTRMAVVRWGIGHGEQWQHKEIDMAKQFTFAQSEQLADLAARKAIGFTPDFEALNKRMRRGEITAEQVAADIERIARDAAIIALRSAGCLQELDAKDRRCVNNAANQAQARHDAFKRATGLKC